MGRTIGFHTRLWRAKYKFIAFQPYWNRVPSVLELGSSRIGTKFHPYWNRAIYDEPGGLIAEGIAFNPVEDYRSGRRAGT